MKAMQNISPLNIKFIDWWEFAFHLALSSNQIFNKRYRRAL